MPSCTMFLGISSAYLAVPPVVLCLVFCFYLWRAKRHDLPPGPPRVPFLGNILQLPSIDQHKTFTGWAVQYGDIVYAEFFTQPVVIVNSVKCAYDLMEKRSARYSERPRFVRIVDMIGWSGNSAFMQYDNRWKRHRKQAPKTSRPWRSRSYMSIAHHMLNPKKAIVFSVM
ncbi:cytochrome P450 [Fomitopsis serialis]|uniref:cytochrome P450 n=1 Tax=Fomitopsis serialis TaxID=139415 RepID=UPI0020075C74|nr:cytochrome P450 [Neoantrodia serialis]KAH9917086.1 cytochrome P450 [Neoantrodia serialis]